LSIAPEAPRDSWSPRPIDLPTAVPLTGQLDVLDGAGVAYIGPDRGIKESVYFKDPDGIQVELIRQPLMEVPESAPQDG